MKRFIFTLIFLTWFATADVFAQRARQAQEEPQTPPQVEETVTEEVAAPPVAGPVEIEYFIRLPIQDDEAGRMSRRMLDRVQTILVTPPAEPQEPDWAALAELEEQPFTPDELRQQAIVEVHQVIWQRAFNAIGALTEFFPNPYAVAHYHYGQAMIYQTMVRSSGVFDENTTVELAQQAVENLEAFVQTGIAPASGLVQLAMLYTDVLDNPTRGLDFANQVVAADAASVDGHFARAHVLRALGRGGEACGALLRVVELENMTEEEGNNLLDVFGC